MRSAIAATLIAFSLVATSSAGAKPRSQGDADLVRATATATVANQPVDVRAVALQLLARRAPRLANYAQGPMQMVPFFARDAVGAALSIRLP